jgi:RNA polymerase sigma-70 factor, ECF subfamily
MEQKIERKDEEILASVLEGNMDLFEEIVKRYQNKIFRFVYQKVLNYEDALELTQEAFLKAYNGLNKFDLKRRFSPWMYKIAQNETFNFIKKRSKEMRVALGEDDDFENMVKTEHDLVQTEYNKSEEDKRIREAINKLPEKYQLVIYYFYLEEMNLKEISDELGDSIGSIKTRLSRGRVMLKEILLDMGIE